VVSEFRARARSRTPAERDYSKVWIGPHRNQFGITDGVGPSGVGNIGRIADQRQLAVCIRFAGAGVAPGHIVDLLLQYAVCVLPAFDDLNTVEIGTDRILQGGTRKPGGLPEGAALRSPPIGTPRA
jgi:hypothetical protein